MSSDNNNALLYLSQHDVTLVCEDIDSVAVIREMFQMHATGQTMLPDEAYMAWTNAEGENARSLNMPGYLGGSVQSAGTKIINGNISNSLRGLPRASGLTLLFDCTSARISCVMDAAYISSLRTASVTLLSAEILKGRDIERVALIGAGIQAQAHLELLLKRHRLYPHLQQILLFDLSEERIRMVRQAWMHKLEAQGIDLVIVPTAEEAIRRGDLVVPVTTTTTGYIRYEWLQPGTILVNVSLDDPLPEVVLRADTVIVDDWMLVKNDTRRLLGRMYRAGQLLGPGESGANSSDQCRRVDAQLGEIITGETAGRQHSTDIILVNPFGLAIEDVAIASVVYQKALELHLGTWLER